MIMKTIKHKKTRSLAAWALPPLLLPPLLVPVWVPVVATVVVTVGAPVLLPARCAASELLEFSDEMLEFILQTEAEVLQAIEHQPLLETVSEAMLQPAGSTAAGPALPVPATGTGAEAAIGRMPLPATELKP